MSGLLEYHTGCRDFNGAVPQSLLMTLQFSPTVQPLSSSDPRLNPYSLTGEQPRRPVDAKSR
jgi:hypothetical protein